MTTTANTSPKILWFDDTACHDQAQVGGKAAHLSRLAADYAYLSLHMLIKQKG